jgi:hypothetical protein
LQIPKAGSTPDHHLMMENFISPHHSPPNDLSLNLVQVPTEENSQLQNETTKRISKRNRPRKFLPEDFVQIDILEYGTKMASKKEKCHDAPKKIKRSKKAEISSMTDKFYSFDWNNPELQGQKPLAEVYDPNVFWHNISNQYFPFTSYGVF